MKSGLPWVVRGSRGGFVRLLPLDLLSVSWLDYLDDSGRNWEVTVRTGWRSWRSWSWERSR